jgi:hypothetical protein
VYVSVCVFGGVVKGPDSSTEVDISKGFHKTRNNAQNVTKYYWL